MGEPSTDENDFIPNDQSYWDKDWQANYGGVDDPERRNGHWPADFTPKQNPFYVALPFGEFTEQNELKKDARRVPWYRSGLDPLLKNRWVEINRDGRSCFAQWQDVGPCGEDDFGFVFGKADKPLNTFDARAGLDVSPAVWHYLGMQDNGHAGWRFVDAGGGPGRAVDGHRHHARQQSLRARGSAFRSAAEEVQHPGGGGEVAPAALTPRPRLLILAPLADLPVFIDMCGGPCPFRGEPAEARPPGQATPSRKCRS